jgi:hypothetical protein
LFKICMMVVTARPVIFWMRTMLSPAVRPRARRHRGWRPPRGAACDRRRCLAVVSDPRSERYCLARDLQVVSRGFAGLSIFSYRDAARWCHGGGSDSAAGRHPAGGLAGRGRGAPGQHPLFWPGAYGSACAAHALSRGGGPAAHLAVYCNVKGLPVGVVPAAADPRQSDTLNAVDGDKNDCSRQGQH